MGIIRPGRERNEWLCAKDSRPAINARNKKPPKITAWRKKIMKRSSSTLNCILDFIFTSPHPRLSCTSSSSMCSDACPKRIILGDVENPKNIMAGFGIRFDIGTRSFLVRVHDNFTPVFRDGAWRARGGTAWRWCMVRRYHRCCCIGPLWWDGRCRDRGVESCLGSKVWLWLDGPDIDDRAKGHD